MSQFSEAYKWSGPELSLTKLAKCQLAVHLFLSLIGIGLLFLSPLIALDAYQTLQIYKGKPTHTTTFYSRQDLAFEIFLPHIRYFLYCN